jgi:glycosyltransferase involved in cell wall biosynthesis
LSEAGGLRILHVIGGLGGGGAERMLKRLIESHAEDPRFRHSVVSLTSKGDIGDALRAGGVEVRTLEMRSPRDTPTALWKLRGLIRMHGADIVQTWMYHADLLGGLAARLAGYPRVIWGIRGTDVMRGTARSTVPVRWACALLSHWVPRVIVCAAEASRRAHEAMGYDRRRMVVIPNGFDMESLRASAAQRQELRAASGWFEGEVVIGCVGRFNPYKDHRNFVRAAGLLAERFANARFLMVGRGLEPGNTELAGWIAATGHADRFVLLGERSDVAGCLSAMDVFCLSSRSEGFPNVVGEAMAAGLPCTVTNVGDAALLVGETGIVVPKEDSVALAEGLARLVGTAAEERRRLGLRARERVNTEFSMARARERFEAIYLSLGRAPRAAT